MKRKRIKAVEMKVTKSGRKLILWTPLERGAKTVLFSSEKPGEPSVEDFLTGASVLALLPEDRPSK